MKRTRPLDDVDQVHSFHDRDTVTKVMVPTRSHDPDITRILTLDAGGSWRAGTAEQHVRCGELDQEFAQLGQ
jgi:hypothetical protein